MTWAIKFASKAADELRALDRSMATRIVKTLEKRIAEREDPRSIGTALKGEHQGFWRWRVGDYRVIADVQDKEVTILVVRIGHRSDVYR